MKMNFFDMDKSQDQSQAEIKINIAQSNIHNVNLFQQQTQPNNKPKMPYLSQRSNPLAKSQKRPNESNQIDVTVSQQSQTQMSMSQVTTSEDEQNRKIVRIVYWQNGLLQFLENIFGLIKQKNKREVNYYFFIRQQIKKMTIKKRNTVKKNPSYNLIEEDSKEDV